MALNDSSEHNKEELILCLFLKVPTGPRRDRETEKESVKKHLKDKQQQLKLKKQNQNDTLA